ncbi:unnamed protein product [Cuscuta epithymum]|uniref:Secreted protein n=1 Tax=Cuscuta epithymum TaxID=186058 RepID=A0AAV0F9W7_9ASTE|nr:unnamed protein product [Cuscuta epithymum]
MRSWIAVAYSAPLAAAITIFLICPIGQRSFCNGMHAAMPQDLLDPHTPCTSTGPIATIGPKQPLDTPHAYRPDHSHLRASPHETDLGPQSEALDLGTKRFLAHGSQRPTTSRAHICFKSVLSIIY